MIARLDEFSKYELQILLNAVTVQRVRLEGLLLLYERNKTKCCVSMDEEHLKKEYEAILLWRIQLLNAIGKVGLQEEIASN